MIRAEGLTKQYGTTLAVDHIDLNIRPREAVGFLGPNGAGKTTTLRILTCFLPPTSGKATIAGCDVLENSAEVRRQIGYLPENNPFYEDAEVTEYLEWIAVMRGISRPERKGKIRRAIERCGAGEAVGKTIGQLSKGYRQRVGLAQTILHDPPILFLDEPTSGLDPNQAREVLDLIRELKKEKTVMISTHILPEVQASCDRVIIIHKGKIAAQGTPQELRSAGQEECRIQLTIRADSKTPEIAPTLGAWPQVRKISEPDIQNGEARYEILCIPRPDIRERIFRTAAEKGWTLLELRKEAASLEEIFRQLTL